MARQTPWIATAALISSLFGSSVAQADAQSTDLADAPGAREQKAQELTAHRRSTVERVLFKLEDDLLLDRVLDPPRGLYARIGRMGEGAGFSFGPAFRYNTPRFDFKTSTAVSTKSYWLGEAYVRFPGTVGQDAYFKSRGPYVEVYGRKRDFPQEDFFGLGPDSESSSRSNYALRDTFASVTTGYQRGLLKAGTSLGHLQASIGPGRDATMPSSDDIFTIDEMPGAGDRPRFVVIEPFVEFATVDRAVNDLSGGRYRVSFADYRDRDLDRYSFRQWEVDLRHYIAFVDETKVIALRAWTVSSTPRDGQEIPFYLQPAVGGSRILRAYRSFRFRDRSALALQGEYRWRVNEFVKGALFYDAGAVGPALDELGRMEQSYGIGLRAGGKGGTALRIDFAFGGRESNRVLIRFDDAF
jgi:hypothetical protein